MPQTPETGNFVIVEGEICRNQKGQPEFLKVMLEGKEYRIINSGKQVDQIAHELSVKHRDKTFFIVDLVAYATDRGERR
jgi:hypothetical protein